MALDLSNLLEPTSMLFDLDHLMRWHGNCHQIKSNKVCHFVNAIELDQIRLKTTILLDLIQSTSIRFSLGIKLPKGLLAHAHLALGALLHTSQRPPGQICHNQSYLSALL
jgi:hypothetical protein